MKKQPKINHRTRRLAIKILPTGQKAILETRWLSRQLTKEGFYLIQHDLRMLTMRGVPGIRKADEVHLWCEWPQRIGLQTGCVLVAFALQYQQGAMYWR